MTMAMAADTAPPRIYVGQVFAQSLSVAWTRLPALAVLAFAFIFVPQALTGFLPPELERIGLIAGLPGLLFEGAAALITYRQVSSSEPIGAIEALRAAMRRFGSLWGMGIISGLGIGLGTLLLIVPGVFLIIAWMPATAAIVAEDIGATTGLDRAWSLTRGCRWALAGLLLLIVGVSLAVALVCVVAATATTVFVPEAIGEQIIVFLLAPLAVTLIQVIAVVPGAAAYAALRAAKEGAGGDVAAIFE
jgi:hypothetical protein